VFKLIDYALDAMRSCITMSKLNRLADIGKQMITKEYVKTLAKYNAWQNASQIARIDKLSDEQRNNDVGAFFSSIQATFSHLLGGDTNWLNRLTKTPHTTIALKDTLSMHSNWEQLREARIAMDKKIVDWANELTDNDLGGDLTYTTTSQAQLTMPINLLVVHFFNHQTNHRAQINTLLSQLGVKAEDTDLILMPTPIQ
jgi:uncharacterized damage-inducible protein DinB